MHRPSRLLFAALLSLALAGPAVAQQSSTPMDHSMQAGMASMSHEMKSASLTGDPDHDFVTMMLPHHQGAVDMAKSELQYGRDPAMRRLAYAIIAAQDREIGQMHAWQAAHPAP